MTYQATVLARSPTLYVPFTETAGTTASDITGNGHDASGSAPFVCGATDGPICTEKAAAMGGNSDGFILANAATMPTAGGYTGGAFTLEYWAKYESADLSSVDGFAFLLAGAAGKRFQTQDYLANNYKFWAHEHVSSGTPDGNVLSAACLDALQCWHHLVFTWDGSASAIYRDGVLLAQGTSEGGSPFGATYADLFGQAFSPTFASMSGTDADHGYINHLAVYPVALSAADVAANYAAATPRCDGDCFAPPDWLRLRHSSGKSYIQQNGDAVQVRAGSVDVLDLPLPVLSGTPGTLVGQDPATGLPAFCPAPVPSTTTIVLGGGAGTQPAAPTACVQVRCGVSATLMAHLLSLYDDWARWLDPLFQACASLGVAVAVATIPWDWIADLGLGEAAGAIKGGIVTLLQGFVGAITGNLLPPLDLDMQRQIQQAAFDNLDCTGDQVQVSAANVAAWQGALGALTTWPISSLAGPFCGLLLQFTPLAAWQGAAAAASPSHACDAWT